MSEWLKQLDWYFNGTLTGECLSFTKKFPFVRIDRDTPGPKGPRLLPRQWWFSFVLLIFVLLFGPTSPPLGFDVSYFSRHVIFEFLIDSIVNFVVSVGTVWGIGYCFDWFLHRAPERLAPRLFWMQFCLVTCGMLFFLHAVNDGHLDNADPQWRELQRSSTFIPFPHLWLPLAFLAYFIASFARPIARQVLKNLAHRIRSHRNWNEQKLASYLNELAKKEKAEPKTSFLRSIFDALGSPVEVFFPPALFIVMIDSRVVSQFFGTTFGLWIYYSVAVLLGLASFVALVFAEHFNAVATIRTNFRRVFWFGGSFLTTFFVIVLAALWLWGVTYVTTVLEGSRLTVIALVLACYALFWNFEYWVNHCYGEELLKILGKVHDKLYVEIDNLRVCVHGSARLSIVEKESNGMFTPRRVFSRTEFFQELFKKLDEDKDETEAEKNSDAEIEPRWTPELSGKGKMYHIGLDALVFVPVAALAFFGVYLEYLPPRVPIETADLKAAPGPGELKDMQDLLFDGAEAAAPGKRPCVILVAASGGGTRAALYTSSVLDGLRLQGKIDSVKAVSGVSGGGVALAYFAAQQRAMTEGKPEDIEKAWDRYHDAMAHYYFIDVLRGAPEYRISWHSSISTLLPESFDRQFFKHATTRECERLGQCKIGVIFNTTLAGESPPPFDLKQFKASDDIRRSEFASGLHAGSRLIFTNLKNRDDFPTPRKAAGYPWNEVLRYVVVNDPKVRLTRAASLNANFPPVFPNAPVDVIEQDATHRYWVTDGGAEENRGQVSLLYAVKGAIERRRNGDKNKVRGPLPNIHLIVVEASGGSVAYSQDFGISAAVSAPQKLANQLAWQLEREIQQQYGELHAKQSDALKDAPVFTTHYLPMPSAFRFDGGVGTHWMLPEFVGFSQPTVRGVAVEPDIYADRASVRFLIRKLHHPKYEGPNSMKQTDIESLWRWRKDDALPRSHEKAWEALCADLKRCDD